MRPSCDVQSSGGPASGSGRVLQGDCSLRITFVSASKRWSQGSFRERRAFPGQRGLTAEKFHPKVMSLCRRPNSTSGRRGQASSSACLRPGGPGHWRLQMSRERGFDRSSISCKRRAWEGGMQDGSQHSATRKRKPDSVAWRLTTCPSFGPRNWHRFHRIPPPCHPMDPLARLTAAA